MKIYFTISEVSDMFQLPPSTLRYWEKEFSQLRPNKINNGERRYTKADLEIIKNVHFLLKKEGYTIEGAKKILKESAAEKAIPIVKIQSQLQAIKNELIALKFKLKS